MPGNWLLLTTAFVPCVNVFTSYWKLDLKFGVQLASTLGLYSLELGKLECSLNLT